MRYFSFITEILQKIILRLMKTHYLMVQIVIGSVKLRSWLYFKKESLQVTLLKYWKRVDSCDSDSRNQCNPSKIALTVCPRQRWLMFNISWQPVVFDSGNQSRSFRVCLQNKHRFDIVSPDLWTPFWVEGLSTEGEGVLRGGGDWRVIWFTRILGVPSCFESEGAFGGGDITHKPKWQRG